MAGKARGARGGKRVWPDVWFVGSPEGYLGELPQGPTGLGWRIATQQMEEAARARLDTADADGVSPTISD